MKHTYPNSFSRLCPWFFWVVSSAIAMTLACGDKESSASSSAAGAGGNSGTATGGSEADGGVANGDGGAAAGSGGGGAGGLLAPCEQPGKYGTCAVAGWDNRPFEVYRPGGHRPEQPTPVVLLLHGGTGNSTAAINGTCAGEYGEETDRADPSCIHWTAEAEGFVVVVPNGTESSAPGQQNRRTWNAGGDAGDWQCVGGEACLSNVDDIAYINAVLDDLETWMNVGESAVFATGLSNGAAMAHRLACELSERIAAIAPVGGANQFAAASGVCAPEMPVAVLQIHGTIDPCWTYTQSKYTCGPNATPIETGVKVGVPASTLGWTDRNGCTSFAGFVDEPDTDGDGIFTKRRIAGGCDAPVRLLAIEGGGHTFPNGKQYLPEDHIGPTSRDWGMGRIWEFFEQQRR